MALYPYQQQVKAQILAGQSVILQAPTGAGKTRAALAPFIESFFEATSAEFPRKCLYSVPMKVLANQFIAEYEKRAQKYSRKHRRQLTTAIQTGDRQDDPELASNLIFTTIDQTLSSFLNIPYALGKRSANLNAGAIVSSYLVFDEFHLYDPDIMLPTVLAMLQMLQGVTPFIVMTATFSSKMLQRLGDLLDAVVVPNDEQARLEMEQIGAQVGKDRRFYAVEGDISAEIILQHNAKRTICICNTVNAAQDLYRDVKQMLSEQADTETHVELLHARFYKNDRDKKEDWIREQFGIAQNEYDGNPLILIATQVIEVGVDATCDVMHTQIAPANALLQRAGRCARRANETGRVYVYLPRDEDGAPNYTPYVMKGKADKTPRMLHLCDETWAALQDPQFGGQHMNFCLEQALIDRVHTPIDEQILDEIASFSVKRRQEMLKTMQTQNRGYASQLIRHIQNQYVIIHPTPATDEKLVTNPWYYDGFGLYDSTIGGAIKRFEEAGEDWQIVAATPVENAEGAWEDEEGPEFRPKTVYKWRYQFSESKDAYAWYPTIAVHPSSARYDTELGFRFEISDQEDAVLYKRPRKKGRPPFSYQRETYTEHIQGLYRAYTSKVRDDDRRNQYFLPLRAEIAFVAQRLEQRHQLANGTLDQLIRILFATHDLGKLSEGWQGWAHRWQATANQFFTRDIRIPPTYMAAHTDYEPTDERQKQAQYKSGKRPHHAGESAIVTYDLLDELTNSNDLLIRAALTAIARHHSPSTSGYTAFTFHAEARRAFGEALQAVGLNAKWTDAIWWEVEAGEVLSDDLVQFDKDNTDAVILYFLLVRVLRLADQRSQIDSATP
ncbi:MAG: CRISPR-associated helicase Cas3' [Candidatus Promineifilaceae bacterium]